MFKHPTVTLTGLMHEDQVSKAIALSKRFDFLEWGVLYSPTRVGGGRYARGSWITDNENLRELPKKALHLCGLAVPSLLDDNPIITDLLASDIGFKRVQLNFNHIRTPIDLRELNKVMEFYDHINFITQHNNSNKDVYKELTAPNHQVLFDQSGGNGVSPTAWKKPLKGKICGYAGGLGPTNVSEQLELMLKVSPKIPQDFWIDMESNIRTNDKLDFVKCEEVLTLVDAFCHQHCKKVELIGF